MTINIVQVREIQRLSGGCCEYCLLAPDGTFATFHIDHIIPAKHGGGDSSDNLCLACADCNWSKDPMSLRLIRKQTSLPGFTIRVNKIGTITSQ